MRSPLVKLAPAAVEILAAGQAEAGSSVEPILLNRPMEPVEEVAALLDLGSMER